jgi:NAD(P)-dependent dehydrogenase (short-subunit alcohol dehydrogenase family)
MQIAGNSFLITGAASGLGAGVARALSAAGAKVVLADVDLAGGERLAAELGDTARFARTDVTSEIEVAQTIELAGREFGSLSGVVQCAGILGAARIVGKQGPHDLALFRRVVEVNLIGTFNVLRLAATAMSSNAPNADGERGVVVNTSSVAALDGQIGQAAYSASKGGVASLSLPAARELARVGIRVVAIAPGVFETPMMGALAAEAQAALAAQVPFPPRMGRPEEFAALVRAIIENPMLNGSLIRLDGALRMGAK